jgi:salicylate hydroxylase
MERTHAQIAVVGGGIGALTAALTLARAGHEVTCYEQAQALREVGAGIQLGPNAARVLHRLGLAEALEATAVRPVAVEVRRWDDGRLLAVTACNPEVERLYGAPYYTLHRADLHSALCAAVPAGALVLGARCVGVHARGREVELEFADGTTRTADAVVGADGIHSQVRRTLVDDEPRFAGKLAYRVLVPAGRVPALADPPRVRIWLGPGKHVVAYPVSSGRLINVGAAIPAAAQAPESWTHATRAVELGAHLRGWHSDVRALVDAADDALVFALHDRTPAPPVGAGLVTLLGDAAHPMLPFFAQGAAQAIEDAGVLARCLADAGPASLAAGLRRYERARGPRTAEVQRRSVRNGWLFQLPDGLRQWARDRMLRRLTLHSFAWLYGYDVGTVALPA